MQTQTLLYVYNLTTALGEKNWFLIFSHEIFIYRYLGTDSLSDLL